MRTLSTRALRVQFLIGFMTLVVSCLLQPLAVAMTPRFRLMTPQTVLRLESLERDADHSYFRPSGDAVSGFPTNNAAAYHRSPCPCLNSLANHGYLPRDGKNLTPALIKKAIIDVFHLDESLAETLSSKLPPTLTLADLSEHNFIEHDASMVHDDVFFGHDPSQVNSTLVDTLLARADPKAQRITKKVIAHFRRDRENECAKTDPKYDFGLKRQAAAYAEAAAFLLAMGDYHEESISVDHARSFLLDEKIPDNWERSPVPITTSKALYVAAQIKAMSLYPWTMASAY
ncbi:hypothetical protein Poli38472_011077 [Pythium oligandrum]|uniref:Heme haloperoxidase family profile domain-containing protein n=1 Tax=Pythium oligandrum TaxID=41045 RepID=A0A8K1FQ10_PYTOL|nr:hypothetical protein Poli38472_011077 [Pythium oligandrum]|eukprot:TMW67457.1 hypothetical protein Poli38472_011077 [Pythium oligandrum]